jgi:hypothetical protein
MKLCLFFFFSLSCSCVGVAETPTVAGVLSPWLLRKKHIEKASEKGLSYVQIKKMRKVCISSDCFIFILLSVYYSSLFSMMPLHGCSTSCFV